MFDWVGRLFGSQKAGEAIVDNVSKGIDKIWYTAEEKAEDAAKARTEGMAVYMKWLESTSGSRLARRLIALSVTGIWGVEHIASVVLRVIGVFVEHPDKFMEASEFLAETAFSNNTLVGVVLLFYFGGPAAMQGVQGLVNKWVGGSNASK